MRVEAFVAPTVRAGANVVEPPPVGAATRRAKVVGMNRFGLEFETTAGPLGRLAPVLPTSTVATGVPAAAGKPLTAPNNVLGVARLARLGPVEMETCFVGADAIGICPVEVVVPLAARTLTVTAAVMIVFLLAIVIAYSFPQGGFLDRMAG
jgi:hypothetical protein